MLNQETMNDAMSIFCLKNSKGEGVSDDKKVFIVSIIYRKYLVSVCN